MAKKILLKNFEMDRNQKSSIQSKFASSFYGTFGGQKVVIQELQLILKTKDKVKRKDIIGRLEDDIRTKCLLVHENLAKIVAFCFEGGYFYILNQDFPSYNLLDVIFKKTLDLAFSEKVTISSQVACALEHIHKQNYTHGDIQTCSILITKRRPYIAQMCELVINPIKRMRAELAGHLACDKVYSAPELKIGDHIPTKESDIYSFAATLYELFIEKHFEKYEPSDWDRNENMKELESDIRDDLKLCLSDQPTRRPPVSNLAEKFQGYIGCVTSGDARQAADTSSRLTVDPPDVLQETAVCSDTGGCVTSGDAGQAADTSSRLTMKSSDILQKTAVYTSTEDGYPKVKETKQVQLEQKVTNQPVENSHEQRMNDWMKKLDDNIKVNRISVPGTHDSLTHDLHGFSSLVQILVGFLYIVSVIILTMNCCSKRWLCYTLLPSVMFLYICGQSEKVYTHTETKMINVIEFVIFSIILAYLIVQNVYMENVNCSICLWISMLYFISHFTIESYTQCQSDSLVTQLEKGIRFIDIRITTFYFINHGFVNLEKELKDSVIKPVILFLEKHKTEFIFLRLKDEHFKSKDLSQRAVQKFKEYLKTNIKGKLPNLYYTKDCRSKFPKVKDVRGKIVLLREFKQENDWTKSTGFDWQDKNLLTIRDDFCFQSTSKHICCRNKLISIKAGLKDAKDNKSDKLCVTFTSATIPLWPKLVADWINPALMHMLNHHEGCCGIVVMDFPDENLIKKVTDLNKKKSA